MKKEPYIARGKRGFTRAGSVLESRVRSVSSRKGFEVSRLLTHWAEIVGDSLSHTCHPVEVTYSRSGMGGTLVLLTSGAQAPMLELQLPQIREKVNAVYGYSAISRIHITQTSKTAVFGKHTTTPQNTPIPQTPRTSPQAQNIAAGVSDSDLRVALEMLGANVLSKQSSDT